MKLFTSAITNRLVKNSQNPDMDHKPVVKLFTPDGEATWLITEMVDPDTLFGLCDLGMGCPELGYVSIQELTTLRGKMGLPVERDRFFKAEKTLSAYAQEACTLGRIIT